ncbi:MAG: alkaline phosphatase, partial [Bradymonadaceae bacterium]
DRRGRGADRREAHAHCPWIVTWDDHEVRNNYAGDEFVQGELSTRAFKEIRAAAYQAYYEHLPLRVPERPDSGELEIYRSFEVGDLVEFDVLDGRQYRSGVSCGGDTGTRCDDATKPTRSMLGADQREWLAGALESSSATWNAIVQQTVFTPINFNNLFINPDAWDGYQTERQEIIDLLAGDSVANPLVLTGDIHMGVLLDVPRDDDNPGDDPVAHEIVTTSMTSENTTDGWADRLADLVPHLGQIRHFNPSDRGYTLQEFRPDEVLVRYRTVSTVHERPASLATDASFRIERGSGDVTEE